MTKSTANAPANNEVRDRILETASDLFYRRGVRAVGVDLVVEKSGVAKTSLYRHFGTKDDLIAAFLKREDLDFWSTWDRVTEQHPGDARAELYAHFEWIGERVGRDNYRGCPQINTAAEFPGISRVQGIRPLGGSAFGCADGSWACQSGAGRTCAEASARRSGAR